MKSFFLKKKPQIKGVCQKVFKISPKKPNSANRSVANILLKNKIKITALIPGEGHNLQEHSVVLVRFCNVRDLPGVKHKVIRGCYDCEGVNKRRTSRSKYGKKKELFKKVLQVQIHDFILTIFMSYNYLLNEYFQLGIAAFIAISLALVIFLGS